MPAPLALELSPQARRTLIRLRERGIGRLARRAEALLMLGDGKGVGQVARALSVCPDTVTHWKRRWIQGRLDLLEDRRPPGRPLKANASYQRLLAEALRRGPRAYGYPFPAWSAALLERHMKERTGVSLSNKRLRHWVRRLGFVYRRAPSGRVPTAASGFPGDATDALSRRFQRAALALSPGVWTPGSGSV